MVLSGGTSIYDAEMEPRLEEQFPFLEVKEEVTPRYQFRWQRSSVSEI